MTAVSGERIGVLGGTFDPLHFGHLAVALDVGHELHLDRVLLVVANDPWQKSDRRVITPAAQRLAMVSDAVVELPGIEASAVEIEQGGESYMADTLQTLQRLNPDAELFLIVGSDTAAGLETWKRPDEVRAAARTVVVVRSGSEQDRAPAGWDHVTVEVPALEISSSDLRDRFATGWPVEALTPATVIETVRRTGLYGVQA